jgi:RND superfamily putative drug exporter
MRQPLISLILAGGILIALLYPFFDINTGTSGVSSMPDGLESKEGFLILDEEFSAGEATPAEIVIDGEIDSPAVRSAVDRLIVALEAETLFATPRPLQVNPARDLAVLRVPIDGDAVSVETQDAIKRLRKTHIPAAFEGVPATVLVTGEAAFNLDFFKIANDAAYVVFPFVLGVSFFLLLVVFRSIVVPIKAIFLNLLAVGATYGLLVLIFQKGVGNEIFGFQQAETIEAWLPIFLFAVLFGLSMDYHVFLLSRIRERFDQTQDNTESVAFGIRSTGRLITGAALIMVAAGALPLVTWSACSRWASAWASPYSWTLLSSG